MGVYYSWVNIDRREFVQCAFMDDNLCKLYQTIWYDCMGVKALYTLLEEKWKGQRILFLGDEGKLDGDHGNPVIAQLIRERYNWEEPGYLFDYVEDNYKDITPIFKDSEEALRPEIDWIISDPKKFDPYHIDRSDPFRGLFELNLRDFRYLINDTKQEFLDREKAQTENGILVNPLPLLMAYVSFEAESFLGTWIGDSLRVSENPPAEGYRDMSNKYSIEF